MDGLKRVRFTEVDSDYINKDTCRRRLNCNSDSDISFEDLHILADVFIIKSETEGVVNVPTLLELVIKAQVEQISTIAKPVEITSNKIVNRINNFFATGNIILIFMIIVKILEKNSVLRENMLTALTSIRQHNTVIFMKLFLGIYSGPDPKHYMLNIVQQVKANCIKIGPFSSPHVLTNISRVLFSLLLALSNTNIRTSFLDEVKKISQNAEKILTHLTCARINDDDKILIVYPIVVQSNQVKKSIQLTNNQVIENLNKLFSTERLLVPFMLSIIIKLLQNNEIVRNLILTALVTVGRINTATVMSNVLNVYTGPKLPDNSPIHQIIKQIKANCIQIGPVTSPLVPTNLARILFSILVALSNTDARMPFLKLVKSAQFKPFTENYFWLFANMTCVKFSQDDINKIVYPKINSLNQVVLKITRVQSTVDQVQPKIDLVIVTGIASVNIP